MRTVAVSEIFRIACGLHGQPWSAEAGEDSLSLTDFRMLTGILSDRLNSVWHTFPWPSLVIYEVRRRLQKVYDSNTQYVSGDQVFDPVSNRCWFCVQTFPPGLANPQDAPANWGQLGSLPFLVTNDLDRQFQIGDRVFNPVDGHLYYCFVDGAFFADINQPSQFTPIPDFDPAFPLDDGWQRPMEEVLEVFTAIPGSTHSLPLGFSLVDDAVRVDGDPGSAWFRYRLQCPEITGDPWDEEATYGIDDQVYFSYPDNARTGDFWTCINGAPPGAAPPGNILLWRKIEIPYVFGPYLQRAVHADWYELDGQAEKAAAAAAVAFDRLQLEFDKIERQQRQREPWTVATR
jgi:hypothetical protein